MGRRLEYEVKTSVRLNMSNPQHVKINDVIQNLDPKIFKSKNQFIIDAIQFYIDNYGKETFVIKKKEKERAEYIRSEDIDDEYFAIIKAEIEDFVDKVYNSIREFGYNLKTTPIVFVGGGAVVMKNFGSHDAKNISYNLDVKANARGYEQLAMMGLKSARRLS